MVWVSDQSRYLKAPWNCITLERGVKKIHQTLFILRLGVWCLQWRLDQLLTLHRWHPWWACRPLGSLLSFLTLWLAQVCHFLSHHITSHITLNIAFLTIEISLLVPRVTHWLTHLFPLWSAKTLKIHEKSKTILWPITVKPNWCFHHYITTYDHIQTWRKSAPPSICTDKNLLTKY